VSLSEARPNSSAKVVLFDLDNALFDRSGTYRTWATGYVEKMALGPAEVEWFCDMDEDGFADRRAIWTQARARFDLSQSVDELLATYRKNLGSVDSPDHREWAFCRQLAARIAARVTGLRRSRLRQRQRQPRPLQKIPQPGR
jgi:hypothetical protein